MRDTAQAERSTTEDVLMTLKESTNAHIISVKSFTGQRVLSIFISRSSTMEVTRLTERR
jgi:hypothetical protein